MFALLLVVAFLGVRRVEAPIFAVGIVDRTFFTSVRASLDV